MGRPTGIKYRTSTPYCDTFYTLTCTKGKVVLARRMRADTTVRAPDLRQRAPSLLTLPLAKLRLRRGVGQEQHRPRLAGGQ